MQARSGGRTCGKEKSLRITPAGLNSYRKTMKWISSIEDPEVRRVFDLYYRQGHTWRQIAMETGGIYDEHYIRIMIRDRYLKSKGIKR